MIYLHGTIGYKIFINPYTKKKIVVFADMHDKLPPCSHSNSIKISKWFEKKIIVAKLLLEEVERKNNMELNGIWDNVKDHTYDLKMLFLENQNIIEPVDIRPFLILFSWEVINEINDIELKNINLKQYIYMIIPFIKLKIDFMKNKKKYINTKLQIHFNAIIKKLYKFILNNKNLLNNKILYIFNNYSNILEDYNTILNDCMEWYICLLIEMYKYKTIIIHAGLYHTEKVNKYLNNYYNYNEIYKNGINYLNDTKKYECQLFNDNIIN